MRISISRNFCQKIFNFCKCKICHSQCHTVEITGSYCKNSVKLTFYWRTLIEIDLTEKNLRGSEFLVFPHCAGQHCVCGKLFRQINSLIFSLVKTLVSRNFCKKSVRVNFCNYHSVEKWEIRSHKKIFRQINYLVISLVKTLLSRNFCQKCMRLNRSNFHTVHTHTTLWKNEEFSLTQEKFGEIN